jgi:hypothetical protein
MRGLPDQLESDRTESNVLPAVLVSARGVPKVIAITLASIPPAAKTLAVIVAVYGVLQAVKKIPGINPTGWVAVLFNLLLTACGLLVVIPADQLYTTGTLIALLTSAASAAGIHGTVKSLSAPTVLATIPPSTAVHEVPATLVPDNPAAVPIRPVGLAKE